MPDSPILCAAVVVRDSSGRVLLLRRAPGDHPRAGMWCLPGGKVEQGEFAYPCALRELREETGLIVTGAVAPIGRMTYLGDTFHDGMRGVVFLAHQTDGEPVNAEPDVHDAIAWFDPAEPPEPLFAGTAEVLGWLKSGKRENATHA